jgi:hypothetical protein
MLLLALLQIYRLKLPGLMMFLPRPQMFHPRLRRLWFQLLPRFLQRQIALLELRFLLHHRALF